MSKMFFDSELSYDDVLLEPQYSEIESRKEVDLSQEFLGLHVKLPIISANMDYVTGPLMNQAMFLSGGLGIFHRFAPWEEQLKWVYEDKVIPKIPSFGARDTDDSFARITQVESSVRAICIDVAHAHSKKVIDLIKRVKSETNVKIIVGNIATTEGFYAIASHGVDAIKVGIGPGAVCTTRTVTGVGVPQLSAVRTTARYRNEYFPNVKIIADGGIKNSGDIVKALAAGADFVMLGHLLAGHDECPGTAIESTNGQIYKPYRGQSIFGSNGLRYSPEGVSGFVPVKGPVRETLKRLAGGIQSGFSYVGARNITELRKNAIFLRVSHGTAIETSTRVIMEI